MKQLIDLARASADDNPLVALAAIAQLRQATQRREATLVRRSRNGGATWTEIATALGMSKQAVHKKYGGRGLFGSQP